MVKKLVFMKTHVAEPYVFVEYIKLARSMNWGDECILFVDNTKNIINVKDDNPLQIVDFNGYKMKCFIYSDMVHKESGLPCYTDNPDNEDCGNLLWFNGDYPFYYIKQYFPDYDYYWCTEYDVYCNGNSYKPFFRQYQKDKSDLICADYAPTKIDPNINYDSEWIYKKEEHFGCFFPLIRLSNRAVEHLYSKRIEMGKLFAKIKNPPDTRWIYCEIYVPTELTKIGFSHRIINNQNLRYTPNYNLNKERVFEFPDYKLYHPVR